MPYRTVTFSNGGHYHLYNRGVARQPIFLEPYDFELFTERLSAYSDDLAITIIAYCLLPNHYHLFVRQEDEQPAGKLPQYVCNGYSRTFNRRHGRQGTLFQGRFGARHVTDQMDAQHLCAYIHGNPVVAGLVQEPPEWPYGDIASWQNWNLMSDAKRKAANDLFKGEKDYQRFLSDVIAHKMFHDHAEYW